MSHHPPGLHIALLTRLAHFRRRGKARVRKNEPPGSPNVPPLSPAEPQPLLALTGPGAPLGRGVDPSLPHPLVTLRPLRWDLSIRLGLRARLKNEPVNFCSSTRATSQFLTSSQGNSTKGHGHSSLGGQPPPAHLGCWHPHDVGRDSRHRHRATGPKVLARNRRPREGLENSPWLRSEGHEVQAVTAQRSLGSTKSQGQQQERQMLPQLPH